jgi:PA14 domain
MTGPLAKEVVKRKGYPIRGQEQAVRIGDLVGVRYDIQSPGDPLKLFNVANDPHQDHDLARDRRYGPILDRMKALLVTARTPDPEAKRPYDAEQLPAVAAPPHTGGIGYRWFDGHWPWLPDFRIMTPQRTGDQPTLALPQQAKADAGFGVEFRGYVHVPADGRYVFTCQSDSGTVLWVHDSLLINDDFSHDGTARSGEVELRSGWHPIRLAYRHDPARAKGAPVLKLTLRASDSSKDEPIAPDALGWGDRAK